MFSEVFDLKPTSGTRGFEQEIAEDTEKETLCYLCCLLLKSWFSCAVAASTGKRAIVWFHKTRLICLSSRWYERAPSAPRSSGATWGAFGRHERFVPPAGRGRGHRSAMSLPGQTLPACRASSLLFFWRKGPAPFSIAPLPMNRLLSPSLSSTRSGGEGARRAGEEASWFMVPRRECISWRLSMNRPWERGQLVRAFGNFVSRGQAVRALIALRFHRPNAQLANRGGFP